MKTQILIPISARSQFFSSSDYYFPKPLTEVAGTPMIEMVIRSLRNTFTNARFIFVVDRDESREFSLDRVLTIAAGPDTVVIERPNDTSGALCSCLLAIDAIDPSGPLLISNSDQIITSDLQPHFKRFHKSFADAGVLTFDSIHPRWSYVVDGGDRRVAQAVEKKVVSRNAIAGIYWFRQATYFLEGAMRAVKNNAHVAGRYFISASLNEMIIMNRIVMFSSIDARDYHSFYSPSRIEEFERSQIATKMRTRARSPASTRVIIPAAGRGSRFASAGWKRPKPFIDVAGLPMVTQVIKNISPPGAHTTLLLQSEHIRTYSEITRNLEQCGIDIFPVEHLTEGTACTVLLAQRTYDDERPMMIANSDQIVDFDVTSFIGDCLDRDLDGSILVFRDATRDPKWSFVRLGQNGLVAEVAEKQPISDLATVGIYLFTRGRDFVSAAAGMIASNNRVNGEFYTCPVYNYLISGGAKIGIYEVPKDSMHGLGTPDDLERYLAIRSLPPSADSPD